MATTLRRTVALTAATVGVLLFTAPAQAATPLYTCMSSMIYVSDQAGQFPPAEQELIVSPASLPATRRQVYLDLHRDVAAGPQKSLGSG